MSADANDDEIVDGGDYVLFRKLANHDDSPVGLGLNAITVVVPERRAMILTLSH